MDDRSHQGTGDGFLSPVTGSGGGAGQRTARKLQCHQGRLNDEATQEGYTEALETTRDQAERIAELQCQLRAHRLADGRRQHAAIDAAQKSVQATNSSIFGRSFRPARRRALSVRTARPARPLRNQHVHFQPLVATTSGYRERGP